MTSSAGRNQLYSIIIAIAPEAAPEGENASGSDWRTGHIEVEWVDFTREKTIDSMPDNRTSDSNHASSSSRRKVATGVSGRSIPGSAPSRTAGSEKPSAKHRATPDDLSLQPLLAHFPGPNPLDSSVAQGVTQVGRGVVHLFRHPPPASLTASLDAHPVGESSRAASAAAKEGGEWAGERAEGEDGSLVAILAVPAWMRPADFLEFIGGWGTCLEGVRMIREATTPNRSIVLLKFRDPLQASDFLVIFTGRAFSTLDARETCHPIRIHHLVLHRMDQATASSPSRSKRSTSPTPTAIPAFPPSVYSSRSRHLSDLLTGVPPSGRTELPSCPVCLERLDSTVTGLVTLPCAHTFDCDCLRKWGDSRCPVCRVSHLLLSSSQQQSQHYGPGQAAREEILRMTKCSMCDSTTHNWICVVCGVVGCGRYEPGKGHARRHWEESGHVLAMELETQRVWDYKGDNYVHRLIQTRTDGKLVELPSASSLVTALSRPLAFSTLSSPNADSSRRQRPHASPSRDRNHRPPDTEHEAGGYADGDGEADPEAEAEAGPSSNDVEKMSTIEAITLEYSYLLSSQLEAMRQHYETEAASSRSKISSLEELQYRAEAADTARQQAEAAREKAERKASKAAEMARDLARTLEAEKAMSEGLAQRVKMLNEEKDRAEQVYRGKEEEVRGLEETVRDLMFTLEAGMKIQEAGGGADAGQGGDLVLLPGSAAAAKGKKKKK